MNISTITQLIQPVKYNEHACFSGQYFHNVPLIVKFAGMEEAK